MCHQSVGLAAHAIEAAGFTTVTLTSAWSITARVRPPRSVFVDAPLGHTAGPPNEPQVGRGIVEMALGLPVLGLAGLSSTGLSSAGLGSANTDLESGVIVDSGYRWPDDEWRAAPLEWSRSRQERIDTRKPKGDGVADTRTERSDEPQYQTEADRRAAEASPPS